MSKAILLALASSLALAASAAAAQNAPAERQPADAGAQADAREGDIVVTARFREERIQDVSTSISALSSEDIVRSGVDDLAQLRSRVPGLDLADRGPSRKTPALRGVARLSNLEDASISSPVVGIYLDEASIASSTANQRDVNTFDLQRIEVLKGPQGTLYGEASMGGTIKYVTNAPDLKEVQGRGQVTLSDTKDGGTNYNAAVMMNVPIARDVFGVRGVFYTDNDGGFIENLITGEEDANDAERYGGRVLALLEPTDALSITFGYHFDRLDRGASWVEDFPGTEHVVTNDPVRGAARRLDEGEDDTDLYILEADLDLGPVALTSITSRYERTAFFAFTDNQVADGLRQILGLPFRPDATNLTDIDSGTWTQELRLVSQTDSPFQYTLGAYYRDGESATRIRALAPFLVPIIGTDLFTDFPFDIQSEQYAVFGEAAYSVSDAFTLRLGARYYEETLKVQTVTTFALPIPPFVLDDEQKIEKFLPRAVVEFKPGPDHLIFASAGKGARNGSFNGPVAVAPIFNPGVPASAARVQPDELWTYEIGSKNEFADGVIRLNISGYYTRWKTPQVRLRGPVTDLAYFGNCDCNVEIWGLDIDGEAELAAGLTLSGAVSIIDAKTDRDFTARPASPLNPRGPLIVPEGTELPTVRDLTTTIALDYETALSADWNLFANISWNHASDGRNFFLPAAPQQIAAGFDNRLPSFDLVNLRLGVANGNISVTAFVTNLINEDALQYVVEGSLETSPMRPRTIGVTLAAGF